MRALAVVVLLMSGCLSATHDEDAGSSPDAGPAADAGPENTDFLPALTSEEDLILLENENGFVDFFLQVAGAPATAPILEPCSFINSSTYPTHLDFLNGQPGGEGLRFEDYQARAINGAERVWWSGSVRLDPNQAHPLSAETPTLVWVIYSGVGGFELHDVRAAHTALDACASAFADQLAIAPSNAEQLSVIRDGEDELRADGVAALVE